MAIWVVSTCFDYVYVEPHDVESAAHTLITTNPGPSHVIAHMSVVIRYTHDFVKLGIGSKHPPVRVPRCQDQHLHTKKDSWWTGVTPCNYGRRLKVFTLPFKAQLIQPFIALRELLPHPQNHIHVNSKTWRMDEGSRKSRCGIKELYRFLTSHDRKRIVLLQSQMTQISTFGMVVQPQVVPDSCSNARAASGSPHCSAPLPSIVHALAASGVVAVAFLSVVLEAACRSPPTQRHTCQPDTIICRQRWLIMRTNNCLLSSPIWHKQLLAVPTQNQLPRPATLPSSVFITSSRQFGKLWGKFQGKLDGASPLDLPHYRGLSTGIPVVLTVWWCGQWYEWYLRDATREWYYC